MSKVFLNTTHQSIAWIKKIHDDGALQMKPPFQRNPVWTDSQKSYLIDTILRGFPVPELYAEADVDAKGSQKYIIVDGQQRVRACLEFIEGRFSMDAKDSPDWADMKFEDLSEEDKARIFSYKFVIRDLPVLSDEILRDIFKRLNRNVVALNAQELRHATYWGPFIKTMETISDLEIWEETGIFTANDIRRMLDVEFISEIAMAFIHGPQNKKVNLEKTYQMYEKEFDDGPKVCQMFISVLGELTKILPEFRRTRWRKKSDFYTLFLIFATHLDKIPLSKEARIKAHDLLLKFGGEVDIAVTVSPLRKKSHKIQVKTYAKAVERSASDLTSRNTRFEALSKTLLSIFGKNQ